MSKYFLYSIILLGLISNTAYASAPVKNTSQVKQKVTNTEQIRSAEQNSIREKISSTSDNLYKNAREKMSDKATQIAEVFEKSISNLKDLAERVQSRISKMDSMNLDTSTSTSLFNSAEAKILSAEKELLTLENSLAQEIPASTSSISKSQKDERNDILQSIKSQSEKTKAAIKTAHASIVDTIESLKSVGNINSTSTPEK